jgi:hypothetical protein
MSTKLLNITPVTPEVELELKAKHGEKRLRRQTVTTAEGEAVVFIIKKPTRTVIQAVGAMKNDTDAANRLLIANCVLAGDADSFENDGEVYGAVMRAIGLLMKASETKLEKL